MMYSPLYIANVTFMVKICYRCTSKVKYVGHTIIPHIPSITMAHVKVLIELQLLLAVCAL